MGFRWDMLENLETNDKFYKNKRIDKEQYKQDVLEKTFFKAQLIGLTKPKPKTELKKKFHKPINKIGFLVITIAVFAIVAGQILPWMYIKYDVTSKTVEHFVNKDFEIENSDAIVMSSEVISLFSAPAYSGINSGSYIGLSTDDFSVIPNTTFYLFLIMILISAIFILYIIFDRYKTFNPDNVSMIHSGFAASCILLSLIIFALGLKFMASYFIIYLNNSYIEALGINDIRLVYIVPIIFIVLTGMIIKFSITIMKLNYRDIDNRIEKEKCEKRFQTFKLEASSHD
jgi:hypothetical protein